MADEEKIGDPVELPVKVQRAMGRLERIEAQVANTRNKLNTMPDHPKAGLWKEKLIDLAEAKNEINAEMILASGRAKRSGVEINVPLHEFKTTVHQPE